MPSAAVTPVLVTLNLLLQIFDGVATYLGWQQFGEGNLLLRTCFHAFGALPTLVVAKLTATALILFLACVPHRRAAVVGLGVTLSAYTTLSLIPWSLRLFA
jgi:Domain of unknown function (DUF5658)